MKRKTVLILSLALVAVVLTAVGTSYALFRYNVTGSSGFDLITGTLKLSMSDSSSTDGDRIVVENLVPIKEETALAQEGYSFTITNTGSLEANYKVYIDDVYLSDLGKDRIDNSKIYINITNNKNSDNVTCKLSELGSDAIDIGTLNTSSSKSITYTLKIWLDEAATSSDASGKYFAVKVRVIGTQKNQEISASSVNTSISGKNLQQQLDELSALFD